MKCRHECTNDKLPRMHQKPVAPALNAKPLNHSKPTNKQINASTNQRSSKDRNMSGNRPLCLPITIFPYFLLIESTKDQGMNNGNLPALAKQRKSMQGPVKHNALPACFGWVWQSNFSLGRIWSALYFTNSPFGSALQDFQLFADSPRAHAPRSSHGLRSQPGEDLEVFLGLPKANSQAPKAPFCQKEVSFCQKEVSFCRKLCRKSENSGQRSENSDQRSEFTLCVLAALREILIRACWKTPRA